MPKEMKYEEAVRQLEEIVAKMESNELDVDSLSQQLKTAQKLIKLCKDKLSRADSDIKKYFRTTTTAEHARRQAAKQHKNDIFNKLCHKNC